MSDRLWLYLGTASAAVTCLSALILHQWTGALWSVLAGVWMWLADIWRRRCERVEHYATGFGWQCRQCDYQNRQLPTFAHIQYDAAIHVLEHHPELFNKKAKNNV